MLTPPPRWPVPVHSRDGGARPHYPERIEHDDDDTSERHERHGPEGGPGRRGRLKEIRAERDALLADAQERTERDRENERRELAYLAGLLAHPHAEDMLGNVYELLEQRLGGDDDNDSEALIGTLVLVEAMKALREKVEAGTAAEEFHAGR